jgi:hypothetical protein
MSFCIPNAKCVSILPHVLDHEIRRYSVPRVAFLRLHGLVRLNLRHIVSRISLILCPG